MGKGTNARPPQDGVYSWEEVKKHTTVDDKWIVIDGKIYDITRWIRKHPGGGRILSHFAGQDATDVWVAMHNDKKLVTKYMKPLLVGAVDPASVKLEKEEMNEDVRKLRKYAEETKLFKVEPSFFILHLAHIVALEVLAFWVMSSYGTGWLPWLLAVALMGIAQAQAGWTQHDYGHLSVFNSSRLNHIMHHFVIGQLMAGSSRWWNFRHFQHHAKPNVHNKDPDITLDYVFLVGNKLPVRYGQQKKGHLPFHQQHNYFWLVFPPLLVPMYFTVEILYFVFKRKLWWDLAWFLSYFVRIYMLYSPMLGATGVLGMFWAVKTIHSFWFVFTTQMSHIPMEIDEDQDHDWLTSQTITTCNVEQSAFNDWFSGHLNFQIEHHLFPTMPRHNFHKIAPLVRSLCHKHNLPYTIKPLGTAMMDIVRSLAKSGQLWYHAYYEA